MFNFLKMSWGMDQRTESVAAVFFLMGEGKFLAGDGRKEDRSRPWRCEGMAF